MGTCVSLLLRFSMCSQNNLPTLRGSLSGALDAIAPALRILLAVFGAAVLGSLVLSPLTAEAQLYDENFESYTDGTTAPGDNSWTVDASAATQNIASVQSPSGDKVFQVQDADGDVIWETESIDISGSGSASFQVVLNQAGEMETSDYVDVAYSVDGGSFNTITDYEGLGNSNHTLTGNWSETNVSTDGISGDNLTIRVTFNNSANGEDFFLDDVKVFGKTRVQFATDGATVQEGDNGTKVVKVGVEIQNPASSSSTSVDVVAVGGSATGGRDDYSFSARTLTFGTSGSSKTVSIKVIGDTDPEGPETVDLGLSNPTGGNRATVGTPGQYTLTIQGDDEATVQNGDVFITEIMYDPSVGSSDGEWVEVHNASETPVDLKGWRLEDAGGSHTIGSSVIVSPGSYVVLCRNANQGTNGGVYCDNEWSGPILNNSGDTIDLIRPDGTVVDKVSYSAGTGNWDTAENASLVFTGTAAADNNAPSNWVVASSKEPTSNLSDPGSPGIRGSDQTTAVRRPMDGVAGWRFVSPPKAGLTVKYLADEGFVQGVSGSNPSGSPNVYLRYNPPAGIESSDGRQYWEAASHVKDDLERGRGVLWYLWKQDIPNYLTSTGSIVGTSSDQTISGLGDHKWHLLGNPFPNAFRIGDITASKFASTAQVWVPNQGTYQTVGPGLATEAVGSQVGFFLERTSGVGGGNTASVTFSAAGQSLGAETITRKRGRQSGRISLEMVGTNAAGDTTTVDRAATLLLDSRAEAGRDRFDATKLTPFSGAYATLSFAPAPGKTDTLRRSVASYPLPADGRERVPLDVVTGGTPNVETLTIRWPSLSLPAGWKATLKDTVAGKEIDLQQRSRYSFSPSQSKTAATVATITGGPAGKANPESSNARPVPPVPVALSRAVSEATPKRGSGASAESRFVLVLENPSALPVELSTFSAVSDGEAARLSWRTASETNNSGFYVEHRADTTEAFKTLGFVEGAGTTQTPQAYTYRTKALSPGQHVFRLRQVDTDGTAAQTDPVSVRIRTDKSLSLSPPSPNPARTRATVHYGLPEPVEGSVTLRLYDMMGRRVRSVDVGAPSVSPGRHSQTLDVSSLSSGVYVLRLTAEGRSVTRKLTVVQ